MRVQKEKAYAKINLYLDVVAMRPDGFHDIKSVMHTVSLCDEITVKYAPSSKTSIKISVTGNKFLPLDNKNLAYKAAALFLERLSLSADIEISIVKNIPVAAGLAGGSADAAAVLKTMNKVFGRAFSEKALYSIAAELGSDIPFCLYGKTALCEGRGEIMTKLPDGISSVFVIAVGNEHISTPSAYKKLDEIFSSFDGSVNTGGDKYYDKLMEDIKIGKLSENSLFNVFEAAVLPTCPYASKIKEELLRLGASAALMSGSGPSVFGLFDDKQDAQRAASELIKLGFNAFVAESVN